MRWGVKCKLQIKNVQFWINVFFSPRTLREIHAKSATSTYVAGVAFLSPHPVPLPLVIGHGLEERGRFDQIVLQNINLITSNFVRFGAHHRSVEILCKLRGGGSSASWRISEVRGGR